MAACCSSTSGALPLWPEQGTTKNHRKPLSCSRKTRNHNKDQPLPVYRDAHIDLSTDHQIRHSWNRHSSNGPISNDGVVDIP